MERFNQNRQIPVYKLPIAESGSGRFAVGNKIGTRHKYVEADKGTNLFLAIYERKDTKERMFNTVPLNEVIAHQKLQVAKGIPKRERTSIPIKNTLELRGKEIEVDFLFSLSPGDLVYVPTVDERGNRITINFNSLTKEQKKRIFFVNDFSGYTCYFRPNVIAKNITPKEVDLDFDPKKKKLSGSFDLKTASFESQPIKDVCIKLKVNRLGNISRATS